MVQATEESAADLVRAIMQATGQTRRQVERELIRRAARGLAVEVLGPSQAVRVENESRQRQDDKRRAEAERRQARAAKVHRWATTRARVEAEWATGKYATQKELAEALSVPRTVVNDIVGGVRASTRLEDVTPDIRRMAQEGRSATEIVQTVRKQTGITRQALSRQVRKIIRSQPE